MEFEFAKATDVTELAFSLNERYVDNKYSKIFLIPDTNDAHIIRLLPGVGVGYEKDNDHMIIEHELAPNTYKREPMTEDRARSILTNDELENWEYVIEINDEDTAIEDYVDAGWGINYNK